MPTEPVQILGQFVYVEGRFPKYANATLANLSPDGSSIVIDFGFIDPLLVGSMQNQIQSQGGSQVPDTADQAIPKSLVAQIQSLERIAISVSVAEQFVAQIQQALDFIESTKNKELL